MPKTVKPIEPLFCSVVLDERFPKPLEYEIPFSLHCKASIGSRVEVPLKGGKKKGYIVSFHKKKNFPSVRPILQVLSQELSFPKELFPLAEWISSYYGCSLSKAFHSMIPKSVKEEIRPKKRLFITLKSPRKEIVKILPSFREKKPQRALVLDFLLKQKKSAYLQEILQATKISKAPIEALVREGILHSQALLSSEEDFFSDVEFFPTEKKPLNEQQKKALESVQKQLHTFAVFLLYGITGSGKTEVYLQLIQTVLQKKRSVLILVPEVALTSQLIENLRSRLQKPIHVFHHKKSQGEKYQSWQKIQQEEGEILIGARSAVFAPLKNLGLIVVDEEHESSYKQTEESPTYHARDIAVMRGKWQNIPVLLGSATPSLESFYNTQTGKYQLLTLLKRANNQPLPKVKIVSQKKEWEKQGSFTHFSQELLQGIQKRVSLGEQTLLFLNKRGFYSCKICKGCLKPYNCPHCSLSLTFHKKENTLLCHLCGYRASLLQKCPSCKTFQAGDFKGFGTQHVEASLQALLPDIRVIRMDRDTTQKKESSEKIFQEFRAGKADVLVGTQMIAKGLHFPKVTMVGILNPDFLFHIPDFRSSEMLFQLLTQVSGRAGREEVAGEVMIQTFFPNHPLFALAAKGDFLSFYEGEMKQRKLFSYPPYQRIIRLIFSGVEESKVANKSATFFQKLKEELSPEVKILPPLPCGHAKIKDKFRFHISVFTKNVTKTMASILPLKEKYTSSSLFIFLDVDPSQLYF